MTGDYKLFVFLLAIIQAAVLSYSAFGMIGFYFEMPVKLKVVSASQREIPGKGSRYSNMYKYTMLFFIMNSKFLGMFGPG